MHHTRDLAFGLCLDRKTIATVSHGDNGVLHIAAGSGIVHKLCQLSVNTVVHSIFGSANACKLRRCVVSHFILREDATSDLLMERSQRFNCGEKLR